MKIRVIAISKTSFNITELEATNIAVAGTTVRVTAGGNTYDYDPDLYMIQIIGVK